MRNRIKVTLRSSQLLFKRYKEFHIDPENVIWSSDFVHFYISNYAVRACQRVHRGTCCAGSGNLGGVNKSNDSVQFTRRHHSLHCSNEYNDKETKDITSNYIVQ